MIELEHDQLTFSFPEVHPSASLAIEFQRTLRIPDDDRTYPLPPGLGRFPLRHVDDFSAAIPPAWLEHGGVMLPMHQAEALWLRFSPKVDHERGANYPFAIKVATGKIDAVTGQAWNRGLHRDPQDYMVAPDQPWLDGYCVQKGVIRQFVAMPLGRGYSAEEQITGRAEHGGLQIIAYPMKREVFERRYSRCVRRADLHDTAVMYRVPPSALRSEMGLAPGGRMKQEISQDPYAPEDWDLAHSSRCFVHIANSLEWKAITGHAPPTEPPTAHSYARAGLPWFDYYGEHPALEGAGVLSRLKTVFGMGREKGEQPLPENESVVPKHVKVLLPPRVGAQVREGRY